jgi:hypothetical protein
MLMPGTAWAFLGADMASLDDTLARVAPNEIFGVSVKWTVEDRGDVSWDGRTLGCMSVEGRIDGDPYKIFGDGNFVREDYTESDIEMAVREAVFGAIGMLHHRMRSV